MYLMFLFNFYQSFNAVYSLLIKMCAVTLTDFQFEGK